MSFLRELFYAKKKNKTTHCFFLLRREKASTRRKETALSYYGSRNVSYLSGISFPGTPNTLLE